MHAPAATQKGSKNGKSIAAYAKHLGRAEQSVQREVLAAEVAMKSTGIGGLADKWYHLAEIHAVPRDCWPALVRRMRNGNWSVERTTTEVSAIRNLKPRKGGAPNDTRNGYMNRPCRLTKPLHLDKQ
jgi:hypothetical protein